MDAGSVKQLKYKLVFLCVVQFGTDRCLNSAYKIRFGKPFLQILIPSRTPLHLNWWRTRKGSITPGKHIGTLETTSTTGSRIFEYFRFNLLSFHFIDVKLFLVYRDCMFLDLV